MKRRAASLVLGLALASSISCRSAGDDRWAFRLTEWCLEELDEAAEHPPKTPKEKGFCGDADDLPLVGIVLLWPVRTLTYRAVVAVRPEEGRLAIELERDGTASAVLAELEEIGARVDNVELEDGADGRSLLIAVRYRSHGQAHEAADRLAGLGGVRSLQWVP